MILGSDKLRAQKAANNFDRISRLIGPVLVILLLSIACTAWSQETETEPAGSGDEAVVPSDATSTDAPDTLGAEPALPTKNYRVALRTATYKTKSGREVKQPEVDFPRYFTDVFRENLRLSDAEDLLDISGLDNFNSNTMDIACGYKSEALIQSHLILDENAYCYKSHVALSDQDQVSMEIRMKFTGTKIRFQFDHGDVPRTSHVSQQELMDLVSDLIAKDQFALVVDGPEKNSKIRKLRSSGDIGMGFYTCLGHNMPVEVVSLSDLVKIPDPVYYRGGILTIPVELPAVYMIDNVYSFPEGETDWEVKTRLYYKDKHVRSCTDGKTYVVYPYYDRYRIEHETDLTYYTESPEPVINVDDHMKTITREYIYEYICEKAGVSIGSEEYEYALPASVAFIYQGPDGERAVEVSDTARIDIIRKYISSYKLGLNGNDPNSIYWEPFEIKYEGQKSNPVELVRKKQEFEHEFVLQKPDTLEIDDLRITVSVTETADVSGEIPEMLVIGYSDELADRGKLALCWPYPVYSGEKINEESQFSVEVPEGYAIKTTASSDSLDQYIRPLTKRSSKGIYKFAMLEPLETVNLSITVKGE